MLFYVGERLVEEREVEGLDAVPVLDAVFDWDVGVGEVEVVEVEDGNWVGVGGVGSEEGAEEAGEGCFARRGGAGYTD